MIPFLLSTAVKGMKRNRLFSIINISGLAVAIACSAIIGLFIYDELTFDRQNPDAGKIYRIVTDFINADGSVSPDAATPPGIADHIKESVPEVENVTKIFVMGGQKAYFVRVGQKQFLEPQIIHVDSTFFQIFPAEFIQGNAISALSDPWTVVLTESSARKYLGTDNGNGIGQAIQIDDWEPCRVTAIVKDPPSNSHFTYSILARRGYPDNPRSNWSWTAYHTYVKLKPFSNLKEVNRKIIDMVKSASQEKGRSFSMQPLTSIHLDSHRRNEIRPNGDRSYLSILAAIGIFILAIACINYINLSTAQSSLRAKEIGIRKVNGAGQLILRKQFLAESFLMSLGATLLGIVLAALVLPQVNVWSGKTLSLIPGQSASILITILLFGLILGLITGFYPAIYLSSFKPVKVLKDLTSVGSGVSALRKSLVVIQFSLAIILMIGTFVLRQQVQFAQEVKLGLDKENVVLLSYSFSIPKEETSILKESLLKVPGVIRVSEHTGEIPGRTWARQLRYSENSVEHTIHSIRIDTDYLACMGIPLVQGRNFFTSEPDTADREIIFNECAIAQLGIPAPVIGRRMLWDTNSQTGKNSFARVVGVVKDFHFESMKSAIEPFVFVKNGVFRTDIAVRIESAHAATTLAGMEKVWNSQVHSWPFSFQFLSADFARLYDSEKKYTNIFALGCLIAIFVSCLGLFGLSTFMIGQRKKEIGIRKVLGASVLSIAGNLSASFISLVIISACIGFPVAGVIMQKWLNGYAYRTSLHWWIFLLALSICLIIALMTVGFQTFKAARSNPVNVLRSE